MRKLLLFILTLCIVFTAGISALEMKEGRIKLVLHENSGRISIYFQNKLVSDEYTSLLLKQDPRTSGIIILIGNRTVRLGDTFEFDQAIENTRDGSAFVWTSKQLKITENFSFVTSPGSSIADGVRIDLVIENISEETLSVGMKYLFDTYLGESSKAECHFYTAGNSAINSETELKGLLPEYWVSSEKIGGEIGLLVMLDNTVVTPPDKVIFANWKRLDESGWTLNIKEGRNFNLLPYSINDSAASHYYEPLRIPSGGKREISLVFGNYSSSGFSSSRMNEETSSLDDLYNRVSTDTSDGPILSTENAVKNELTLTEDLITHIDRLLESEEPLSADELDALQTMIDKLETSRNRFED